MYHYKMSLPTTWNAVNIFGSGGATSQILFNNNIWVAVGNDSVLSSNKIYWSTDSTNWTICTFSDVGFIPNATGLVYGNGKWVVSGRDNNNNGKVLYYSTDGKAWNLIAGALFGTQAYSNGGIVSYFPGAGWFSAGAYWTSPSAFLPRIISSSDGITWSGFSDTIIQASFISVSSIYYNSGTYIACGQSATSDSKNISFSTNGGTTWTGVAILGNPGHAYGALRSTGGTWVVYGIDQTTANCIYSATNVAGPWTPQTSGPFSGSNNYVSKLKFNNGLWVGFGIANGQNATFMSTDATNWSNFSSFSGAATSINYLNNIWVLTGTDGGNQRCVYSSPDGTTWTGITIAPYSGSYGSASAYTAEYGNGSFLIGIASPSGSSDNIYYSTSAPAPPCFLEGTEILTAKGYLPIESLRPGDMVQTLKNGFVPIHAIGKRSINHNCSEERIKNQLYVCSPEKYPGMLKDLVITGCHSVLVSDFTSDEQKNKTKEVLGYNYVTDALYRLPACVDQRSKVYDKSGEFMVYHIALENNDYYMNYGVFANGLLVETTSKRYLLEISGMKLLGN